MIVSDAVVSATPSSLAETLVWFEPGRLMWAGGSQFLNGGTTRAEADSNGQLISYRFLKNGRYLVICMNRMHLSNDRMFGFVNVVTAG